MIRSIEQKAHKQHVDGMTMRRRRLRQASTTNNSVMRRQQWRTSLALVLCILMSAQAFTNPALTSSSLMRGGDTAEEDQQIDEYIENLIASVDSSSDYSSEDVRDDVEAVGITRIVEEAGGRKGRAIEEVDVIRGQSEDADDEEVMEPHDKDRSLLARKELDGDEVEDVAIDKAASLPSDVTTTTTVKRKKRTSKSSLTTTTTKDEEGTTIGQDTSVEQETTSPQAQFIGPARPNALYRFLLNQGRVGHFVVMICVLIVEFITTYIPPLAHLLAFLFSFVSSSSDKAQGGGSYRRGAPRGPVEKVNAQYAAFVSSDGTSVRGKQRKKAARKVDEQAAEKLRRVGSVQEAKFRHVSNDFMKRHRIGSYRDDAGSEDLVVFKERDVTEITLDGEEEESDVDWVVQALSKEEQQEKPASPLETSFGVGLGSDGATISVGVQIGSPKKKQRRKTIAEAATERTPIPKKRPAGPRTSDRDGGGGVLGRIRAAGANSLVSRSLLGAYPGDAVPPSEAGSSDGVVDLAEKYGYGDWSDDDQDESSDNDLPLEPRRRQVKKRGTTKRKRSKPSSSSGGVSIQFGLSSSDSTRSRQATTPKRPTSTRRDTKAIKDPTLTTEKSEILTGKPESILPERKRVQVRPPMEKLNLAKEKAKRKREED